MTWKEAEEFSKSQQDMCKYYFKTEYSYDIALDLEILDRLSPYQADEQWSYVISMLRARLEEKVKLTEKRLEAFPGDVPDGITKNVIQKAKLYLEKNS